MLKWPTFRTENGLITRRNIQLTYKPDFRPKYVSITRFHDSYINVGLALNLRASFRSRILLWLE